MAKSTINKPELEALSYHSSLCKCPECGTPQEARENFTPIIEPKTPTLSDMAKVRIEADKAVHAILPIRQPEQPRICKKCQVPNCGCRAVILKEPEQPKDNPGPLENVFVNRIGHDLENIAANLEMLKSATKEQDRPKCVLILEIAHITGEGGMFDDLKEAFE